MEQDKFRRDMLTVHIFIQSEGYKTQTNLTVFRKDYHDWDVGDTHLWENIVEGQKQENGRKGCS